MLLSLPLKTTSLCVISLEKQNRFLHPPEKLAIIFRRRFVVLRFFVLIKTITVMKSRKALRRHLAIDDKN